jgi:hypothetical protein
MTLLTRPSSSELPRKFLARKRAELRLIGASPALERSSKTLDDIFASKLRAAGLRKAEFTLKHANITETSRDNTPVESGRYDFDFSYQRADLKVNGPKVGGTAAGTAYGTTRYTGSGMAALAVVLTTARRLGLDAVSTTPGHYPETAELAQALGVKLSTEADEQSPISLLDSAAPSTRRWPDLVRNARLIVFDTSCYAATSQRIHKWVTMAREHAPVVLVRSHAKLDTLGVEYGRLGSVTILPPRNDVPESLVDDLTTGVEDAIRLLGAAPVPVSFPPFAGEPGYIALSRQRAAQMQRNSRIACRILSQHGVDVQCFQHGLYLTAAVPGFTTRQDVEALADTLAAKLAAEGLPVRHAGSFGFDFVGLEWFCHAGSDETVLRIASGDVPAFAMERIAKCLSRLLRSAAAMHRTLAVMPESWPTLSDEERVRLAALPVPHYGLR